MSEYKTLYPDFDVLHEEKKWDPHTREIVDQRLKTQSFTPYQFFTPQEADTLFQLCSVLLDDKRYPIVAFVVHHFDSTLKASLGESQRKIGVPKQPILIRDGLALLDQVCNELISEKRPCFCFMDKILSEAVAAYYSHPFTWSEIGNAGPAYPRGFLFVRSWD